MFSKEHVVIAGLGILLGRWLQGSEERPSPAGFWIALAVVTIGFVAVWLAVGWVGESDQAAVFYDRGTWGRLAIALPALLRAALILIWPASLSVDYTPRVLPARVGMWFPAVLGFVVLVGVPALVLWSRRRAPAISFAAGLAGFSYLPTANLFFSAGVVLAERNLYLAAALPAVLLGWAATWLAARRGLRPTAVAVAIVAITCGWGSSVRLPVWRGKRFQTGTLPPGCSQCYPGSGLRVAGPSVTVGHAR